MGAYQGHVSDEDSKEYFTPKKVDKLSIYLNFKV